MEFSIKSIIKLFRKNLILILLITILAGFCSYGYTKLFVKNVYSCDVKFCVNTIIDDFDYSGSIGESISALNYSQKLVDSCIQALSTNSFFEKVSQKLDGKYSATKIKSMVSYSCLNSTEYFRVLIKGTDKADIKKIGDAIAELAPPVVADVKVGLELKLVDPARVSSSPISPNINRNIIVGTAGGFAIIILILLMKEYFDVRIKSSDEKLEKLGLPILARIPDFTAIKKSK